MKKSGIAGARYTNPRLAVHLTVVAYAHALIGGSVERQNGLRKLLKNSSKSLEPHTTSPLKGSHDK
jgi:hypothetical protein